MKKSEIYSQISDKTGESVKNVGRILGAFWEGIEEQLKEGRDVCLTGVGTFRVKRRPERNGINPQTRKQITIPAKNVIVFKPSHSFTDRVNG